ncbi:85/88 kDa calcium-independent phospholipase A2 [Trichinella pseudospiralis]|uniref:phospholipase A2 n=1 Tax=Trichinella pseudospiralis TaxID=6337 RepID=A0A0V1FS43_TRIPS|nr:85/88 kDa calcium-independent phospholipase A2 [Trichinella pseudospiralis]
MPEDIKEKDAKKKKKKDKNEDDSDNAWDFVKEKIIGIKFSFPKDPTVSVIVPKKVLKRMKLEESFGKFSIHSETNDSAEITYHIVLDWKESSVSMYRMDNREYCKEFIKMLYPFEELFFLVGKKTLSKLVSLIKEHPLWKPVHVAAMLGIMPYFQALQLQAEKKEKLLELASSPEGQCALHLAIANNNIRVVKYLMHAMNVPPTQTDKNGKNALHYAAATNEKMIKEIMLTESGKQCLNALDIDGCSPMLTAISACKPGCILLLFHHGAKMDRNKKGLSPLHHAMMQKGYRVQKSIEAVVKLLDDPTDVVQESTGNRALHVARNKQTLLAFLNCCPNFDVNVKNKAGQTALHVHTSSGKLDCVVALYYNGANVNIVDNKGNTCLHIAVANANELLVKALLVFGADPNVVNCEGETPRHIAAMLPTDVSQQFVRYLVINGALPCQINNDSPLNHKKFCTEFNVEEISLAEERLDLEFADFEDSEKYVLQNLKKGQYFSVMITIDGGGIRGLIALQILIELEKRLKAPIYNYIDWAAGTSTGGLIASSLVLKMSLRDTQRKYLQLKDEIFERFRPPYPASNFEQSLQRFVGISTTMAETGTCKLLITSSKVDVYPATLHLMRNYLLPTNENENKKYGYEKPENVLLWRTLRCTTAAPFYFSTVDEQFIDGGLMANNPTIVALFDYAHCRKIAERNKVEDFENIGCLLSIGTGQQPRTATKLKNIKSSNPYKLAGALKDFAKVVFSQITVSDGYSVRHALFYCNAYNIPIFRFSPPMSKHYRLNESKDSDAIAMMWETVEYIYARRNDMDNLAALFQAIHPKLDIEETLLEEND